jgi:sarcosine oxidase/L-pipecolate oxidase
VTPHPHSKNLFLATGGSFHGWKFLPVIGDYIVQMLRGTLQQDLYDKWAWDKKTVNVDMEIPTYKVSGDVEDLFAKK